jgi:hypothetical protein
VLEQITQPGFAIEAWAWKLTPLTARILAGWFALMGVGSLVLAVERRWSACRFFEADPHDPGRPIEPKPGDQEDA